MQLEGRRPEEARALLEKANAARVASQAARRASTLRRDFDMEPTWNKLASARGIRRLPLWGIPPTPTGIRRWLMRLGVTVDQFLDWAGAVTLSDFAEWNPDWPLRALVGLLLEDFPAQMQREQPELGDLVFVRWRPFPRCDRWLQGHVIEVDHDHILLEVPYYKGLTPAGQPYDYTSSSGCARGCTDGCDRSHGLQHSTHHVRIRREGLVRAEASEGPLRWQTWDDAIEWLRSAAAPRDSQSAA
jgi:hypothetical protein